MRHRKAGRKFKRTPSHRRMLLRNLATSLFEHGKITTTVAKAKELQPYAEKMISMACRGLRRQNEIDSTKLPLAEFRRCLAVLTRKDIAFKLFYEIAPTFENRSGGYTRIFKLARLRQGDCSQMAVISLLAPGEETVKAPQRPAVVPASS